ncbi:hypothetical protein IE81DRAFT_347048 [Ceraceosorus guamensis]|uniref:WD40 repeat-like protein n=1 Tax=Ceraceosorus guamensis TaxID=1522189 RepID=A0A316VYX9_9BASI|nr:hypothetical protein IE81DRAFT_347048 [Ceraceosorus guamensis]PWN42867.1 hypothetical protein IE81DRAFT_347048 [Ceraceosorus guamensis]
MSAPPFPVPAGMRWDAQLKRFFALPPSQSKVKTKRADDKEKAKESAGKRKLVIRADPPAFETPADAMSDGTPAPRSQAFQGLAMRSRNSMPSLTQSSRTRRLAQLHLQVREARGIRKGDAIRCLWISMQDETTPPLVDSSLRIQTSPEAPQMLLCTMSRLVVFGDIEHAGKREGPAFNADRRIEGGQSLELGWLHSPFDRAPYTKDLDFMCVPYAGRGGTVAMAFHQRSRQDWRRHWPQDAKSPEIPRAAFVLTSDRRSMYAARVRDGRAEVLFVADTWQQLDLPPGHKLKFHSDILRLAFMPDRALILGLRSGLLNILSLENLERGNIKVRPGPSLEGAIASIDDDGHGGLIVSTTRGSLLRLDRDVNIAMQYCGHVSTASMTLCVVVNPVQRLIAAEGEDHVVRIWRFESPNVIWSSDRSPAFPTIYPSADFPDAATHRKDEPNFVFTEPLSIAWRYDRFGLFISHKDTVYFFE